MGKTRAVEIEHITRETAPLEDRVLLTEIVRSLVSVPAAVRVRERVLGRQHIALHIDIDDRDRGALIGRAGATITAIRQVFQAIGVRDRRQVEIVLDSDHLERPVAVAAR